MESIVSFDDFYTDRYEYSRVGKEKGKIIIDKKPNEINKFFKNDHVCPFCKSDLEVVFKGTKRTTIGTDLMLDGKVIECPNCGWWKYKTHFSDSIDCIGYVQKICSDTAYYGIVQKYNLDDKNLPINILIKELEKRKELLYGINPYKLEELVQYILEGVYDCEVHHVGKTGDGGKDLIVLESDEPILVQVKRRENPSHVELVKGIREFVGTLFIEGSKKGIYVSTAKKFSRGAKDVATNLLESRKLTYFELIDFSKFCGLLKNTKKPDKIWKDLLKEFYEPNIIDNVEIYDTKESIDKYYSLINR